MTRGRWRLGVLVCVLVTVPGCSWLPFLGKGRRARATVAAERILARAEQAERSVPPPAATRTVDRLAEAREQMQLEGDEVAWCLETAARALALDSLDLAERALEDALRRQPTHPAALTAWSEMLHRAGRSEEAVVRLAGLRARGATLAPEVVAALAIHQDALDAVDEARTTWSSLPQAERDRMAGVGVYLALRGDHPEAGHAAAEALAARHGDHAVHLNNLGLVRLRRGEIEAARQAFLAAARREPSLPGPYYNLAILERFYAFDDSSAARWYARYRARANQDPDGLGGIIGTPPASVAGKEEQ
jgi:tetratricopeptide (TPR) repeat protein